MTSYTELPNLTARAANGVTYAYRYTGGHAGQPPLVLLQHFRGNLDYWDPALIDALAATRRVITVDYAGAGGSTGTPADTMSHTAADTLGFLSALGLSRIDLLGFSIGSFVAQEITLRRPCGTPETRPLDVTWDDERPCWFA